MSDEELVRRLRAVEEYGKYDLLTDGRPERLRNPDGPDAADAIERLSRELEAAQVALDEAKHEKVKLRRELRKEQEATLFLTRRLEAAEREVEKLRDALEPFASCVAKDGLRTVVYPDHANTVDFLNARATLAETEKGDE